MITLFPSLGLGERASGFGGQGFYSWGDKGFRVVMVGLYGPGVMDVGIGLLAIGSSRHTRLHKLGCFPSHRNQKGFIGIIQEMVMGHAQALIE